MTSKRIIEVFTAGCPCCDEALETVREIACDSCEVVVRDMRRGSATEETLQRAREYGIKRVPAVAVDGTLASCCTSSGVDPEVLRNMGVGVSC